MTDQPTEAEQRAATCPKCSGSGLIDPDGTTVRPCSCELGRKWQPFRPAAPVILHPGKTHEEILTWLLSQPGKFGLGDDEWDALRWARGRIADLTGDVQRYVSLLEKRDADYRLLLERHTAFVEQIQSIVDYHQQQGGVA